MNYTDITVMTCGLISMAFAFSSLISDKVNEAIFYAIFTIVIFLLLIVYKMNDIYYALKYNKDNQ